MSWNLEAARCGSRVVWWLCRSGCEISERYGHFNIQSRGLGVFGYKTSYCLTNSSSGPKNIENPSDFHLKLKSRKILCAYNMYFPRWIFWYFVESTAVLSKNRKESLSKKQLFPNDFLWDSSLRWILDGLPILLQPPGPIWLANCPS